MREISVVLGWCHVDPHGAPRIALGFISCFKYSESLKELERLAGYPRMPALCHVHV